MELIEALEILTPKYQHQYSYLEECPRCGALSVDKFIEELKIPEGLDDDERDEFIDEKVDEFSYDSFTPSYISSQTGEGPSCSACGWSADEEVEEAQTVVNEAHWSEADRVEKHIENLGGSVSRSGSGLSEASYIEFYDADGNERKIRIAAHTAKPTYMKMHGEADFEAVICPECYHPDADGDVDDLLDWIKRVGVEKED